MKRFLHISLLLLALVALSSCNEGPKVIPESKLSRIYADLYMADYWLEIHEAELGSMQDTSLVYEPIFEKYGYTSDDFRASITHYLTDTDRYARILKHTTLILEARLTDLKAEKARQEAIKEKSKDFSVYNDRKICFLSGLYNEDIFNQGDTLMFFVDTTGAQWNFDPQKGADTAYYGPEMIIREDLCSDSKK